MSNIIPIVQIGFRTSGVDSGNLDYSVDVQRLMRLSDNEFAEVLQLLDAVKESCTFKDRHKEQWDDNCNPIPKGDANCQSS